MESREEVIPMLFYRTRPQRALPIPEPYGSVSIRIRTDAQHQGQKTLLLNQLTVMSLSIASNGPVQLIDLVQPCINHSDLELQCEAQAAREIPPSNILITLTIVFSSDFRRVFI